MKLPTLYSRRSDGRIQEWTIQVVGNKYRTISGLTDGEKVTAEWTECQGKNLGRSNATTPEEQARSEAQSAWTKKRERGYFENARDVDKTAYFEPMLAQKYEDYKDDLEFPVFAQPKLDGIRCILTKDGMFTRNGKTIVAAPHILEGLKVVFRDDPKIVLDGELYADKLSDNFNRITSLVRKSKPSAQDLADSANEIQYWIYDFPSREETFEKRWNGFVGLLQRHEGRIDTKTIVKVPTRLVESAKKLDALYGNWLEEGFEGQIIRLDGPYENKRSKNLLKRKEFMDAEFQVLDVEEGVGNRSKMAGRFVLRDKKGNVFHSNIKGDRALLRDYLQRREELQGKLATVQFFQYTPDGIPRFPFVIAIRDYE